MKEQIISKTLALIFSLLLQQANAANYPLEIIQPQPNFNTNNRYYKAYPGIEYEVPVVVFGGAYPFTYTLTTSPSGMTIDEDSGKITWSNPTTSGSPHSVTVRVSDNEGTTDFVSWTITVTTSGFIFLDSSAGDGGNGTISSPLNSLQDVWGSNGLLSAYDDYFMYFRAGTYVFEGGYWQNCPGQQCWVSWNVGYYPHVWMAYPGETVIIDHDGGTGNGAEGAYLNLGSGADDVFVSGIKFQDFINHALRIGGTEPRVVIYNSTFYNGGPGVDGANSSMIMTTGGDENPNPGYHAYVFNTFEDANYVNYMKLYSVNKIVIANNDFGSCVSGAGLAPKDAVDYADIRANTFHDCIEGGIRGNNETSGNIEIRYNLFLDTDASGCAPDDGAFSFNQGGGDGGADDSWFIYRNTFEGNVLLKGQTSATEGPFNLYNNVIVNENASCDTPDGSLITISSEVEDWTQIMTLGTGGNANLVGRAADGIIDANGNLTSGYDSYLGTHGYQLADGSSIPPLISVPEGFSTQ